MGRNRLPIVVAALAIAAPVAAGDSGPIPWPDGLPDDLYPAAFERNVHEALARCAPDLERVGFECSEPPCFVLMRPRRGDWWDDLVNRCRSWRRPYSNSVAFASGTAACPDGREETYAILGWSWHLVGPRAETDPEVQAHRDARFRARIEAIRAGWVCAAP